MSNIIEVEHLNFYYGNKRALEDINMKIRQNQVTALIGPSGCGKSTFLRCLNRMNDLIDDTRTEGLIQYMGEDINGSQVNLVHLRRKVGMIFQKANPFPKSIYENVLFGPKRHRPMKKAEQDELVESALRGAALWNEVKDTLHKSAFELSGGQQQRLSIARVIAARPDVILMDEPTSALDPLSTQKVEELVQELKENYTIVIVTHNMQQAARISDSTGFFLNGRLIEHDTTNNIFYNPKDKKTEDYISGRFG
ncbi:Phosphate import ATP-binding protein PstB 3 [anaerobic digester metagenome]